MSEMNSADANKRKQKLIAFGGIGAFLLLIIGALWASDPNTGKEDPRDVAAREKRENLTKDYTSSTHSAVSDEETWISKSEKELNRLRNENKESKRQFEAVIERLKFLEKERKELQSRKNEKRAGLPTKPTQFSPAEKAPVQDSVASKKGVSTFAERTLPPPPQRARYRSDGTRSTGNTNLQTSTIQVVSLKQSASSKKSKKQQVIRNIRQYLPTGSLSKGVFLSGVDAPTGGAAQAAPLPILIRVKNFGALPNYARSHIKDCHVIGAATGNISSERVEIRLETLTCVLRNGDVVEVPVKGYVTGEDGKLGMRGKVVEKEGQFIARALWAGTAAGLGETIVKQNQTISQNSFGTVTSIDPGKTAETGIGSGIGSSLEKLADYYYKRLDEMYPVIELDAGRIGDIILTGGSDLGMDIIGKTNETD